MKRLVVQLGLMTLISLVGCENPKKSVMASKDGQEVVRAQSEAAYAVGDYRGVLPCADCEGIETQISLRADNTYEYASKYVNKSDDIFMRKGRWKLDDSIVTLDGVDYKFRLGNGILTQLDLQGEAIEGELAKDYILAKVD